MTSNGRWTARARAGVGLACVALLGLATTGCGPRQSWTNHLVSVSGQGTDAGNARSEQTAVSPDGTKVAFVTRASNLGPPDTNGNIDVYLRDLTTGTTTLVSANAAGTDAGNSGSSVPRFSPDGTKLAFVSNASDLGPADGDEADDIYVRDLAAGTVVRVEPAPGPCGDAHSQAPVFSPDGSKLAFSRDWWDESLGSDVYVHDLASGTTTLASPHTRTDCGEGFTVPVGFSPDGSDLVLEGTDNDLGPVDTDPQGNGEDVFVRDLVAGRTSMVSANAAGTDSGNGDSSSAVMSPDGTRIAFRSDANDLGPADSGGPGGHDIYLRDLTTDETSLVSINAAGTDGGNALTGAPAFSPDGQKIAFATFADDLGPTDANGLFDAYVRDLRAATTELVSVNAGGTGSGAGNSGDCHFLTDGEVVFASAASDLVAADGNGVGDIFVRNLARDRTTLVSHRGADAASANGASDAPKPSADGSAIVYGSLASDLGPTDTNGVRDIYVANRRPRN